MNNVITIGKRLIPVEQIVLVEPFDPATNAGFKSDRPFKARIVLHNRDTVLSEDGPDSFADRHGFRLLVDDHMAVNPNVAFRIEVFAPTDDFRTDRPLCDTTQMAGHSRHRAEQAPRQPTRDRHCHCSAER